MKAFMTISILLFSFCASAQLENHNWYFGQNILLNFEDPVSLETTASLDAPGLTVPSGISDASGNPLFYTDGENVFDANGDVMPNGSFDINKEESLVHPDPFDPSRYYVVRSGFQGTDYSVVDMDLNGGLGDLVEDEKEVFISQDYARLISTSNSTDNGRWLILISNGGISELFITVYEALPNGGFDLDAGNVFDYTFAGWEEFIDDAAITRDCDLLAISFKGHYFVLFGFDNETGLLTQYFDFAGDTGDFFGAISRIEFSPSGQYLYVMGENTQLSRFDISSLDQPTVVSTQESVSVEMNDLTDIKLGPDDRLYILGNDAFRIDALDNIEGSNTAIEYEASVFEQSIGGAYFPNTPNIYCGLAVPFFNLPPQQACLGEEVTLDLGYNFEPDSLLWDLGIEVEDESLLESLNPTLLYPDLGSYPISAGIWLDSIFYTVDANVVVSEYPVIELGEDQTICQGEELVLDPGDAELYNWNTGSVDSTLVVTESGVYSVVAANGACAVSDEVEISVIPQLNPDIGDDAVVCGEDEYTINSNISGEWNTGDSGLSITVDESGLYSVTVSNACFTATDSANISFVALPESQLPDSIAACAGEVITLDPGIDADSYLWNTEEETASIEVTESGTYSVLMDFQGCPIEDETTINFVSVPNAELGENVTLCDENEYTITSNIPGEWNNGEFGSSITVQESGFYTVSVSNECFTSTDSIVVTFINVPPPQLPETLTGCIGSEFVLDPQIDADSFVWNTGHEGSTLEVGTSGTYSVIMDYQGCPVEDEVVVTFEEYIPVESLIIPNIFSPNGDSRNEVFRLSNSVLPNEDPCDFPLLNVELNIYNRWGNLIREGECEWDGKNAGGDDVSEGTYYFLIDVKAVCFGETETKTIDGSLELVR